MAIKKTKKILHQHLGFNWVSFSSTSNTKKREKTVNSGYDAHDINNSSNNYNVNMYSGDNEKSAILSAMSMIQEFATMIAKRMKFLEKNEKMLKNKLRQCEYHLKKSINNRIISNPDCYIWCSICS